MGEEVVGRLEGCGVGAAVGRAVGDMVGWALEPFTSYTTYTGLPLKAQPVEKNPTVAAVNVMEPPLAGSSISRVTLHSVQMKGTALLPPMMLLLASQPPLDG